jgi:hypothetical protein
MCLPQIYSSQPPLMYTHSLTPAHPLHASYSPRIQQATILRGCWNAYLVAEHLETCKQTIKIESLFVCCEAMPDLEDTFHFDM